MGVVETYRDGVVGWITFNRPDVLNAINEEVFAGFARSIAELLADPQVRVGAITGAGRAFSSGADIEALAEATVDGQRHIMECGHAMMASVEAAPKPVIAAVTGIAAGGGFELALACDFVFAERRARFGLTEIRYGFLPGGGGTQRLPRRTSWADAMHLICSGDLITADQATGIGLVFRLIEDGDMHAAVQTFASTLERQSAEAVAAAKALMRRATQEPLAAGLQAEIAANLELMQSPATVAAMAAFRSRKRSSRGSKGKSK
jgi:enoyl-CoA hydratase/carnithine racemase